MLQFHDIRDAAAEFLEKNLHSSNCLGMMLLSDAHQCKRLYELSWRMCLLHYETVRSLCIVGVVTQLSVTSADSSSPPQYSVGFLHIEAVIDD